MRYRIFDKAQCHWGAKNAPANMPPKLGATHIAFFFRWCIEKNFVSKEIMTYYETEFQQIKSKALDCRDFFMKNMDGILSSEELNTKGCLFAAAYYSSNKTQFASAYGYYLTDYRQIINDVLHEDDYNNAFFYFENTEENYLIVKKVIEKRYNEFLLSEDGKTNPAKLKRGLLLTNR